MPRTIRVSVREEVTERQTIDLDLPDDLDIEDTEALQEFFEDSFVQGTYRQVPNTNEVAIRERYFFDPEVIAA